MACSGASAGVLRRFCEDERKQNLASVFFCKEVQLFAVFCNYSDRNVFSVAAGEISLAFELILRLASIFIKKFLLYGAFVNSRGADRIQAARRDITA